MKPFTTAAVMLLAIVALVHLFRLLMPFDVTIAGYAIPQWANAIGLIIAGGLALMVRRESASS